MDFIHRLLINFIVCFVFALIRVRTDVEIPPNVHQDLFERIINDDQSADHNPSHQVRDRNHHSSDNSITNHSKASIEKDCSNLKLNQIKCDLNYSCIYGTETLTTCLPLNASLCQNGSKSFPKTYLCSFCYQLPPKFYSCNVQLPCQLFSRTLTVCNVDENVLCLGHRKFFKYSRCEHKTGYKWSTALLLSITLGGFGVDRFYLGNWQEGIGKLFSFGGLGIWTLIDVILIGSGYLKPNDGSVYV
ncbi:TM2 domain-containing protein 3-like protein [Sarcoptes scabiei]|uniref:TM2 domain-containing protein 3-like protein n=1 Tax=Sarcoptes scabiei TaxID=52283 RepID=A0A132ACH1_SARSC|nr:TM2 domain-containing protein 3-like protein [Sarcoptes scabiei]